MPTFTLPSSGLEVLASAALAQLPSAQGGGSVPPISSTDPANPGLLNIPGFASVPTKLIQRIWGLEYVDMWDLLPENLAAGGNPGQCMLPLKTPKTWAHN